MALAHFRNMPMAGLEEPVFAHAGKEFQWIIRIFRRVFAEIRQPVKAQILQYGGFQFNLAARRHKAGLLIFAIARRRQIDIRLGR